MATGKILTTSVINADILLLQNHIIDALLILRDVIQMEQILKTELEATESFWAI